MPKKDTGDYDKKFNFIYTLLQKKIDTVDVSYGLLATKSGILFGFDAAAIAFYLGLLLQNHLLECVPQWVYIVRLFVLGFFLLALVLLFFVLKMRGFDNSPHKDIFLGKTPLKAASGKLLYGGKRPIDADYQEITIQVIKDLEGAFVRNSSKLQFPTKLYTFSLWLLLGSVCLMILSVFLK